MRIKTKTNIKASAKNKIGHNDIHQQPLFIKSALNISPTRYQSPAIYDEHFFERFLGALLNKKRSIGALSLWKLGTIFLILVILNTGNFLQAVPLHHGKALTPKMRASLTITQYYVSEKLDGVRGYWDGEQLRSRQGLAIVAPQWFTENLGETPIEGEIWLGRETFQSLSGLIARSDAQDPLWNDVTFQIFDMPAHKGSFNERVIAMKQHISMLSPQNPHLKMVAQEQVDSWASVDAQLKAVIAGGGEGLMLHHEQAVYQPYLRHTDLLKVKEIDDGCAIIRGFTAGKGKYQEMVGAFEVEVMIDDELKRFKIGSGLTDKIRQNPPEIGTKVIYLHNGFTERGIPRFPRLTEINATCSHPE